MASFSPFQLLYHLTLHYTLHGQQCQNGFYFTNRVTTLDPDDFGTPLAVSLTNDFMNHSYPVIKAFQNNQVHYNGIVCSTLIPHEGPLHELGISVGSGDQPDESLPSYCAAILTLRSGFSGKSNRGRLYFAGVSEADSEASILTPSAFTALEDIGNQLQSRYGAAGSNGILRHIIFSRKHGYSAGTWSNEGIRGISNYVSRRNLGTQRHRLIGQGT